MVLSDMAALSAAHRARQGSQVPRPLRNRRGVTRSPGVEKRLLIDCGLGLCPRGGQYGRSTRNRSPPGGEESDRAADRVTRPFRAAHPRCAENRD